MGRARSMHRIPCAIIMGFQTKRPKRWVYR